MKKRPVIGISITVLVLAVVIGIASLPDEVLIDSTSIENSKTLPEDTPIVPTLEESQDFIANSNAQKNLDDAKAEIDALKNEMSKLQNELVELKTTPQVPEENLPAAPVEDVAPKEASQEKSQEDTQVESQGKVIKVSIQDGVGAKQR